MSEVKKSRVSRFFLSDKGGVVICILLSAMMWFFNQMNQVHQAQITVPVGTQVQEGMSLAHEIPENINVTLKGRGWRLSGFLIRNTSRDSLQLVEMSRQAGTRILSDTDIEEELIRQFSLNQIQVIDMNHRRISFSVEPMASKKVAVAVSSQPDLAEGFTFQDDLVLEPDSVIISGPKSLVGATQHVFADLEYHQDNITGQLTIDVPLKYTHKKLVRTNVQSVLVSGIAEQLTDKTLFVPVEIEGDPDSINVFPNKVQINCQVGLSRYNEINEMSFTATAAYPPENNETSLIVTLTSQPDYARKVTFRPKVVEFYIMVDSL